MQKFFFIQSLRGIAALWVALFHCSEGDHIESLKNFLPTWLALPIFDAGHYGVAIFFALSGFAITHSLRDANVDLAYAWKFILRRSIRLDPPYWASMILVVAFAALSAKVVGKGFSFPSLNQVLSHIFYAQELLKYPEISSVYWTLTFEVQFYFFLVATYLLISKHLPRMLLLTLIALFSAMGALRFDGLFLPFWCSFFIGALAYWARTDLASRAAFVILLVTMIVCGSLTANLFIVISALAAFAMYAVCLRARVDERFGLPILQFMGAISYSLYLIHNPITGASFFITSRLLGFGVSANLAGLGVAVAACIIFSFLFWKVIERPSQLLGRRVFESSQEAA